MIISSLSIFLLAYLLGSIPSGLLLTRAAGLGDIRDIGSGNIGATNVLRTGNKKLAALTLLLDFLKGVVAVLIAAAFDPALAQIAALGAVMGHMFPVWLKFKGGKGVATGIGVITALHPLTGLVTLIVWLPVVAVLRISSLATLIVAFFVPLLLASFGRADLVLVSVIIIGLIFFKHRANIHRLINRTEPKINLNKNAPPPI
ncbi:MAG: glycerol-3-phosphate 1-O-acyltransferase PlsY [Bdellovibrionales bacterium]